jgi:hypothetical protein
VTAVALFIGYAVMLSCGVLLAVAAVAWAFNRAWAQVRAGIAWGHLRQAVREWHVNHPEESARWHRDKDVE